MPPRTPDTLPFKQGDKVVFEWNDWRAGFRVTCVGEIQGSAGELEEGSYSGYVESDAPLFIGWRKLRVRLYGGETVERYFPMEIKRRGWIVLFEEGARTESGQRACLMGESSLRKAEIGEYSGQVKIERSAAPTADNGLRKVTESTDGIDN